MQPLLKFKLHYKYPGHPNRFEKTFYNIHEAIRYATKLHGYSRYIELHSMAYGGTEIAIICKWDSENTPAIVSRKEYFHSLQHPTQNNIA